MRLGVGGGLQEQPAFLWSNRDGTGHLEVVWTAVRGTCEGVGAWGCEGDGACTDGAGDDGDGRFFADFE